MPAPLLALGQMAVDFKQRVDIRRLYNYRLGRTRTAIANSGLGAVLTLIAWGTPRRTGR